MAGSTVRDRVIYPLQKRVVNPIVMLAHNLGIPPPGDALLETTGRRTGRPVRTPVCDGLDGEVFWLIAQRGRRADWIKNIQADPRVRVKVRTGSGVVWRAGTARIVDEDDPRERQRRIGEGNLARRLCVGASAAVATDPLTVRVDVDTQLPSASAQLGGGCAEHESSVVTMQYSREHFALTLRGTGFPEAAEDALRVLPDPVEGDQIAAFLLPGIDPVTSARRAGPGSSARPGPGTSRPPGARAGPARTELQSQAAR